MKNKEIHKKWEKEALTAQDKYVVPNAVGKDDIWLKLKDEKGKVIAQEFKNDDNSIYIIYDKKNEVSKVVISKKGNPFLIKQFESKQHE